MQIDKGFYSITQTNSSTATLSSKQTNSQEFSQILAQEIQSTKLSGNTREDLKNGLISREEYDAIDFVMDGARITVGLDLAERAGKNLNDYDINFDELSGRVKQFQTLINGDKGEREWLLNAYKTAFETNRVIPSDGRKSINAALNYINRALNDL